MKPQIILPNPRISIREPIPSSGHDVRDGSEAWLRKMALLESIHTEISPQLEVIIANEEDDFIPGQFLK